MTQYRYSRRDPTSRKLYEYGMALRPLNYGLTSLNGYAAARKSNVFKHGVVQYSRPLSKSEVENYDLVPLDPQWPAHSKQGYEAFLQLVMNEFSDTGLYSYKDKRGNTLALTESTRPNIDFQVTSFDQDMTPVGHRDYNDFDRAVREFWGALPANERKQWISRIVGIEGEREIIR